MKTKFKLVLIALLSVTSVIIFSCEDDINIGDDTSSNGYENLLMNQFDNVIVPSMTKLQTSLSDLQTVVSTFKTSINESNYNAVVEKFDSAYIAYQIASPSYYRNVNIANGWNEFPLDTTTAKTYIENQSYSFSPSNQKDAGGFPMLDYLLFNASDAVAYFNEDSKRIDLLDTLVKLMYEDITSDVTQTVSQRERFLASGGVNIGSSISTQLNRSLIYYEAKVREAKVGIPIGLLGPNDTPFDADTTKIEALYRSGKLGNKTYSLKLLKAAIKGMENIYLGRDLSGDDGYGYDDLLLSLGNEAEDTEVKAAFAALYTQIENTTKISDEDDQTLYDKVQAIITEFKEELLPALNVQDTDGANDGD